MSKRGKRRRKDRSRKRTTNRKCETKNRQRKETNMSKDKIEMAAGVRRGMDAPPTFGADDDGHARYAGHVQERTGISTDQIRVREDQRRHYILLHERLAEMRHAGIIHDSSSRWFVKTSHAYNGPADFVLQHGSKYVPTKYDARKYGVGAPAMCFGNSIAHCGLSGLLYVEGYALSPFGKVILHAWNTNAQGELIDTTWRNSGLAYCGVVFSLERADDATWNGDACVLDDHKRNYPLFASRWPGELPADQLSAAFPDDVRVRALREGNKETILKQFNAF
jgi:hypothetical protein